MKKVLASITLVTACTLGATVWFYASMPAPVANSVIAGKPGKTVGGNQAAVVLPEKLTTRQHKLLTMAYKVAKENGFANPEVVQAVLLQETLAGGLDTYRVANPGKEAYFGPMQIKLAAARDVLSKWPELYGAFGFHTRTDDEIKANLILNDHFNIEVGTRYLLILKKTYGFSGRKLMNAYNRGPGGVHGVDDDFHYAREAEAKLAAYKKR